MTERSHTIEDVEVLRDSPDDLAILIRAPGIAKTWVPRSQILDEFSDLEEDRVLCVKWWWAEKAGIV